MTSILQYYDFVTNKFYNKISHDREYTLNDMIIEATNIIKEITGDYGVNKAMSYFKNSISYDFIISDENFSNGIFFVKESKTKILLYEKNTEYPNNMFWIKIPKVKIKKIGMLCIMDIVISNTDCNVILDCLTHNIKSLTYNENVSKIINVVNPNMPNNFKNAYYIHYHPKFNGDLFLSDNITHIELESYDKIFEKLPQNLLVLKIKNNFNLEIPKHFLPDSLVELELGDDYDNNIDFGMLPPNLKILKIGKSFSRKIIQGILPPKLKELTLGSYKHNFEIRTFPISLKKLSIEFDFNFTVLEHALPDVTYLFLGHNFNQHIIWLPKSLKHIKFGNLFNTNFDIMHKLTNLEQVEFGDNFNKQVTDIPPSLKSIKFPPFYDHDIPHIIDNPGIISCICPSKIVEKIEK